MALLGKNGLFPIERFITATYKRFSRDALDTITVTLQIFVTLLGPLNWDYHYDYDVRVFLKTSNGK